MKNVQNKVDIIRSVLNEIEAENRFTDAFRRLPVNSQRSFDDFSPEQIYFDLIKYIIDQDELPSNVCGIQIHMNNRNEIEGYELISLASDDIALDGNIQIVWEE